MKRLPLIAIVFLCGVGVAAAQVRGEPAPAPDLSVASFDLKPTGRDFAANYPTAALRTEMPGIAVLCCAPKDDQSLACAVAVEWPQDQGFGAASLKIAEKFRVSQPALERYRAKPSDPLTLPIRWQTNRVPSVYREPYRIASERLAQIGAGACRVPPP